MYKTMHKDNKRKKQNNCVVCFKSFYEEVSFKSVFSFNHCICDNCLQKFKSIDKITTICGIQTTFLYEYNDFFKSLLYQYKACYDIELKDVFLYKYKKIINKKYKNYVVIYPPSNKSENLKRGFIHIKEITSCLKLKSVDKKTNKGQNYAIVDGGIHHSVYYGQTMAMKFPHLDIYPARNDENTEDWNLMGSLCTINDIIIKQYPVSNLQIGDAFIFKNTGAYCMTEGISLFLSRELPQVALLKNDNLNLVRDAFKTYTLNKANYNK